MDRTFLQTPILSPPTLDPDREAVRLVARLGLVEVDHLMAALGVGRTAAYRRVARLVEAGLLERPPLPLRGPAPIRATREGLRWAGLGALPLAVTSPSGVEHMLRCATVALRLEEDLGGADARLLAERELALAERVEGRPLAGARLATGGHEGLHRPDLAILGPEETIAIEVELSVKAPRRLEAIMRAWRRASHVGEVRYLCGSPAVRRAVGRAVETTYSGEKVTVEELAAMTPHQQHVTESVGAWLWSLCWPLLAGAVLGALLLLLLHRRGLRWTWSLIGVPLTWCAWFGPDRRGAVILGAATATAIWTGHRLRAEGLALGGEEAHRHRDTLGPTAFLRSRLAGLRDGRRHGRAGTLAIGRDRRGRPCRVPLGSPGHGVHVLVVGATGSGKTVSQDAIIGAHVRVGQGVISVDPKGDPEHLARLEALAAETGARLVVWSPRGDTVYNPLRRGDPTEIADKALAAHEWTEPHYELATRRLLGHALATMKAAGQWPPTLSGLVAVMEPDRLDALASKVGGEVAGRVCGYVDSLSGSARADLGGGRDRLAVLVESELGPCLDPALGDGEEVDLAAALDHGDIVHLHLDSDRYPAASRLLAQALVIDLVGLAAARQDSATAAVVAIDEFGAVAGDQVSRLFARARGAGISVVLGTQSLADLRAVGGGEADTLTEQVISNVSYTLAHRVADPDSAERLARVAGTEPAWAMTQQVEGHSFLPSGQGTRMRQRDFIVGPDQFKRLGTGEAVLIRPTARPPARIVRVRPPQLAPTAGHGPRRSLRRVLL